MCKWETHPVKRGSRQKAAHLCHQSIGKGFFVHQVQPEYADPVNQGSHNGHTGRHERRGSHGAILVTLELGVGVRDDGQCPEAHNL